MANEAAMWQTLVEAGLGHETPNSFVVLAGRGDPGRRWPSDLLGAYYAVGRRAVFSSETRVVDDGGTMAFERRPVLESGGTGPADRPRPDGTVELVSLDTPFEEGEDLLARLARCDNVEFGEWIERWATMVTEAVGAHQPAPVDLLPHNLIVTDDGELRLIDSKFLVWGAGPEDVLARGALIAGQRLSLTALPDHWGAFTVEGLVRHLGALAGLHPDGNWLPGIVAREAAFQATVALSSPEPASPREAADALESTLWADLRRPLVHGSSTNLPARGVEAVERELGRLGGAYQTLIDSQRDLSAAYLDLVRSRDQAVSALTARLADLQSELDGCRELLADAETDARHLRGSTSWKLTAPFRALSRAFRPTS